mgnify:CR=1 FL=1
MSDETISGTIKVGWTLRERDMVSAAQKRADHKWTAAEIHEFADRLEEVVKAAIPDSIRIHIDGEDKPGVRVGYDCGTAITEIEVDDGFEEIMGTLDEIRERAEAVGDQDGEP